MLSDLCSLMQTVTLVPTLYQALCWVLVILSSHERMVPACARSQGYMTDDRGKLSSASDQEPSASHGDRLVFIISWSWATTLTSYFLSLTILIVCQFTFLYTENKYLIGFCWG